MKHSEKTEVAAKVDHYISIPLGSLVRHPEEEDYYLNLFKKMPAAARRIVTSSTTGAFIRGLLISYKLPAEGVSFISFLILQVVAGEIKSGQVAGQISSKLSLANDKAEAIANEIERDLVGPIKTELEEFWAKRKNEEPARQAQTRATEGGARNVLNLKKENQPPVPPWRSLQNK